MAKMLATASIIALLAAAPAWAAENANGTAGTTAAASQQGASGQTNAQDQKFVEKAGSAGKAEVAAGDLALKHAVDPAVREFGRWMATDHTAMGEMLAKHAEAAGLSVPASVDPKDQATLADLQKLTGPEFDLHYLRAQFEAHKQALELFKEEADSGQNAGLKMLAQHARPMLEQHLAEVQELQSTPQSSTSRSAQVNSPPAAPMQDPKAAKPALQNGPSTSRNKEGAQRIEKEGK